MVRTDSIPKFLHLLFGGTRSNICFELEFEFSCLRGDHRAHRLLMPLSFRNTCANHHNNHRLWGHSIPNSPPKPSEIHIVIAAIARN